MKKILERLTVFFIGLPLILSSVYFLPQYHFLFLHLEIFLVSAVAVIEVHALLSRRIAVYSIPFFLIIGLVLPLASYLNMLTVFPRTSYLIILTALFYFIFFIEIFYSFSKPLNRSIQRMCSAVFIMFYPGFFMAFISGMTRWPSASNTITIFLLMVFICDSMAWLCGMLFGKRNRGIIPASPNKSLAGFIGGIIASVAAGLIAYLVFPETFGKSLAGSLFTGFCTALAAIIGDLVESILKRSADVKDSGAVILGRGGIMDSIDSILLGAPVFYLCYRFCIGL
ncbi:MAG: phosphatidate cytidylyltransferase [Treponema sp.]